MRNNDYYFDELRTPFIGIEDIVNEAETIEELEIVKQEFKNAVKTIEAYFMQVENEISKEK